MSLKHESTNSSIEIDTEEVIDVAKSKDLTLTQLIRSSPSSISAGGIRYHYIGHSSNGETRVRMESFRGNSLECTQEETLTNTNKRLKLRIVYLVNLLQTLEQVKQECQDLLVIHLITPPRKSLPLDSALVRKFILEHPTLLTSPITAKYPYNHTTTDLVLQLVGLQTMFH